MLQGRVRVNGIVVTELGTRVDPEKDIVEVDGRRVRPEAPRWILLYKPGGTLTTRSDTHGRPTVYHLLPAALRGLGYVGRLDRDTEGLLLLTNEGDIAHALLHPSAEVEREYHVGVHGLPGRATLRRLVEGVDLEDGPARARSARGIGREPEGSVLSLVLLEGRKREVKRMLDTLGHPVRWLRRVRFGPQQLGELDPGRWRELHPQEVERLRQLVRGGRAPLEERPGIGRRHRR